MYDRHLYPGGACRLHTLCCELGDDSFWQGVRAYLARYRGEVVETDDFRRVLEEVSGRSLGRFFDQWFYSPGYPAIKVRFKHDAARGEGRFTIEQTQADAQTGERAFHPVSYTHLDVYKRQLVGEPDALEGHGGHPMAVYAGFRGTERRRGNDNRRCGWP